MKLRSTFINNFIYFTTLLHIILFTYAAVSKILDFQNFQIQIGQSPLLSAFAVLVSYSVPIIEFTIVLFLILPKYRLYGLYGSFLLMTMFSTYVYIIMNYSSFTPCSCGGILEQMSWNEHLIFNIVFVVLSGTAIIMYAKTKFVYEIVLIDLVCGMSIITLLFLLSENIIEHQNNFVRRLPEQINKVHDVDLTFNSYYFAGIEKGKIYLGNSTSPFLLTEIDTTLNTKKEIVVKINNMNLPFRSLQIQVYPEYFFVSDGTVPAVFRGKTGKWEANYIPLKNNPFANQVFIDSTSMAYRTRKPNGESILGCSSFGKQTNTKVNPALLQKQIDGIFDTDGYLMFDAGSNKLVYIYYYRNQFIIADAKLNLSSRGKTIDTISKAQIKVVYNPESKERKLASPPLIVNKSAITSNGLLFVQSTLTGKFEDRNMWKQASMIDVYDISTNSYVVSFYVYHIDGKKLKSFMVLGDKFYALVGTHLVSYKLNKMIVDRYTKNEKTKI